MSPPGNFPNCPLATSIYITNWHLPVFEQFLSETKSFLNILDPKIADKLEI
jgi:hypothetical protein